MEDRRLDPPEDRPSPPRPPIPCGGVPRKGPVDRLIAFLRAHPVLLLLALTPGIPEYLSGSSPVSALLLNPGIFLVTLAGNLGLYGSGVLLIREASVRWKKGWGTVLALGIAYATLEEGVALSTMFDPMAGPVGSLGYYGHWIGVNWVWAANLTLFHALWSVSLPILLFGLALPETRGKPLLTDRQVWGVGAILSLDVLFLLLVVGLGGHFWAGPWLWAGAATWMASLVLLAPRIPARWLSARTPSPTASARAFALAGLTFYPGILVCSGLVQDVRGPPAVAVAAVGVWGLGMLWWVLGHIGREKKERQLIALGAGLIGPLFVIQVGSQLATGPGLIAVAVVDLLVLLFFRQLWRRYPDGVATSPPSPRGATAPAGASG
jgi:hypothetical protein